MARSLVAGPGSRAGIEGLLCCDSSDSVFFHIKRPPQNFSFIIKSIVKSSKNETRVKPPEQALWYNSPDMPAPEKSVEELIREFFELYPDYPFCQALAINIKNNVTTYRTAIEMLARKSWAEEQNREEIRKKLDSRLAAIKDQWVPLKDLSLRQIMDQGDEILKEIIEFYLKHPYAHGRTRKTRLLPRTVRTLFLSVLLGHAKRRGIDLDYAMCFEILRLL